MKTTTEISENEMGVYHARRELDSAKATLESRQRELAAALRSGDSYAVVTCEDSVRYYELLVQSSQRALDRAIADLSA